LLAAGQLRRPSALHDVGHSATFTAHSMVNHDLALAVAEQLCVRFEGFRARPYLCPAGVWTIGYGTTVYPDGRAVAPTDVPIDKPLALRLLRWDLVNRRIPAVLKLCPGVADERLGALVDFCYNLGAGKLRASTLRKRVNAGRWDDVPGELRKWVYAAGKQLNGLKARREAEIDYI
jgi:lysozyme